MDSSNQPRMEISDLPIEILDIIFNYLTVYELKQASLVCRQWSHLAFSGLRMDHVRFNVHIPYRETISLIESQRQYRHIGLGCSIPDENIHIEFIQAIQGFKKNVKSLRVDGNVELSQILHILLEVPNLKALSLKKFFSVQDRQFDGVMQLPVFHQLYDLELWNYSSMLEETFDICSIVPNLQRISITCCTENDLKVFRHFSHQLQSVKASFDQIDLQDAFCKISFPELLEMEVDFYDSDEFIVSRSNCAFIAGSKRLQRATLKYANAALFVNMLVENCRGITFLHIRSDELGNQCLNGLANLPKLTILKLEGELDCNVFEACQPISSLQELHLVWTFNAIDFEEYCAGHNTLEFFKGLPMVMPNLSRLCISECLDDAWLQFIFNNMLSLKCLELNDGWISGGGVHFNRLPHLIELRLNNVSNCDRFLQYINQSFAATKVKTLSIGYMYDDDLLKIPAAFPSLRMLHLADANAQSKECIEKLRSLMPFCTVIVANRTSK